MDNIMDERFTAQEIDAIKAEADLDIKRPLVSLEEQPEKIRDLKVVGGDGDFWRRKYCVLSEALRLAKKELQLASNERDVLHESLTCRTGQVNTLQETVDLQISKLQMQDGTIERLEKNLADGARERASLNDVLENALKQMHRLANAGFNVATQLDTLRSDLNRKSVCIGLLVTSNVLLGICIAIKHFT